MKTAATKKSKSLQALPLQARIKQLCFSGKHKKTAKIITSHPTKHDRRIIIVNLWQVTPRQFRSCHFAKKEGTIQYGYMKRETHVRVLSQTLAHAWEQQEWDMTKKQMKKVWRGAWVWKEVQRAQKKNEVPTAQTVLFKIQ